MSVVLCGIDFSPQSRAAARLAAAWAAKSNQGLRLVHVWEAALTDEAQFALQAQAREQLGSMLEDEASSLRAEFGAPVDTLLLTGVAYETLLREAVASHASLLVVASLGRGYRHGWLLGSTAERIAQRSTVPVLVVRDAPALLTWLAGARHLAVNVCVDLTAEAQAALRWARNLRRLGPCSIELDYVAWPPAEPRFAAQRGEVAREGDWTGLESALAVDVALWAGAVEHAIEPEATRAVVNWGRPDAALLELARAAGSALIVAGSHRRSHIARLWQGSVTRGLLHHADANVACIPPPAPDVSADTG